MTTPINSLKAFALVALGLAIAAFVIHGLVVGAPLFAEPHEVPSLADPSPTPHYAAAVERARALVRAAMLAQNLPGVSVAVGVSLPSEASATPGLPSEALAKEGIVWAEGFGWRDVGTRTPVTPTTRFHIGTAASVVTEAAAAPLGLAHTSADAAKEWSPEAIGEEGEDFPPLTLLRHVIFQPLGLMAAEYPLPGERATFYVPRVEDNDPRRGRRLMYMRDLACCANGMAFSSTPSDLVRFAQATAPGRVSGELAGGLVMSVTTARDGGIVVAVMSNMAYANTSALAHQVADAFAGQER